MQRRKGLTSRKGLRRDAALERGSGLKRGGPIRSRSAKMQAVYEAERIPLVKALLEAHPLCQYAVPGVCTGYAVDVDEIKSRAAGGSITDPENCRTCCRACHNWKHRNPVQAHDLGILKWSHED